MYAADQMEMPRVSDMKMRKNSDNITQRVRERVTFTLKQSKMYTKSN